MNEKNFAAIHKEVTILVGNINLQGSLHIPAESKGIILFAHGSGSSRHSPRNQHVARLLNQEKLGTLLFDLLTIEEERLDEHTLEYRFNIPFLAKRLTSATLWLNQQQELQTLGMGYFGSSTGAAAALVAAAENPELIAAVVSRGGRPDLAGEALSSVKAPTLLIVGGLDVEVLELNRQASEKMQTTAHLEIVPGATHLFEEPGKLDEVATLAAEWFKKYLV